MTAPTVATIIRCGDLVRHVYSTLETIERQSVASETVLITDETTPPPAAEWIRSLAESRKCAVAHSGSASPGAVRNAGINATTAPYIVCVDSGDALDPRFYELAVAAFDGNRGAAVVTSWVEISGPGAARRVLAPRRVDVEGLVGDTEAIHSASMFRRDAWAAVRGFDESLAALDDYDFWLRVLSAGKAAVLLDRPLLIRRSHADALYQRGRARELRAPAMATIAQRHWRIFENAPLPALFARSQLHALRERNRDLVARREAALNELDRLKTQKEEWRRLTPEPDTVDLGDLARTTPVSRDWGYERGGPVDRFYIEQFLAAHADDIRGAVLEVQEPDYTKRFGGVAVTRSDVIDLDASNPKATIVSDLRHAANIPSAGYDCIILTQTIHVVDDMAAVISECARILKPGGVLLSTLPCASRVCLEYGDDGDFWRVTEAGAQKLFSSIFPRDACDIRAVGNVLTASAFLHGLGSHELTREQYETADPYFPLLVTVRAQKPNPAEATVRTSPAKAGAHVRASAVLLYHRVAAPDSDVHGLCVSAKNFRRQIAHLKRHYDLLPLEELAAAVRAGTAPAGAIAVTFDDGYLDNYSVASPILSEFSVPATFFVTTDRLSDHYEYWWDVLERVLLSSNPPPPELRIDLPDGACRIATCSFDERLAAHQRIYDAIAGAPAATRDAVIDALRKWTTLPIDPTARRMTKSEIVEMSKRPGHSIGAHTVRHLMLPRQPASVQREEIEEGGRSLETLLGRRVTTFAYPFGAFSTETVEAVRAARFEAAVTCEEGPVTTETDPLRLPRLEVRPECASQFDRWLEERIGAPITGRRAQQRHEA